MLEYKVVMDRSMTGNNKAEAIEKAINENVSQGGGWRMWLRTRRRTSRTCTASSSARWARRRESRPPSAYEHGEPAPHERGRPFPPHHELMAASRASASTTSGTRPRRCSSRPGCIRASSRSGSAIRRRRSS